MWTQQEIESYVPRPYGPLLRLYAEKQLPITFPEKRADFLAHSVLNFKYGDELGMMVVLHEKGMVGSLNHLEDLAIEKHKRDGSFFLN